MPTVDQRIDKFIKDHPYAELDNFVHMIIKAEDEVKRLKKRNRKLKKENKDLKESK